MIAIFRSKLREGIGGEFRDLAARMLTLAQGMPGFVSYKVYVAEDGERCSVIEFDTREHLLAWREQAEHREAQRVGRERFYEWYTLHVCEPERESLFGAREGPRRC